MALAVSFVSTRRLPALLLMTAVLVLVFAGLTLYLQDATFIKMKPTVLYAPLRGSAHRRPRDEQARLLSVIFDSALAFTERGWRLLTLRWGGFFFALAVLNEIVWRTEPNRHLGRLQISGNFSFDCSFLGGSGAAYRAPQAVRRKRRKPRRIIIEFGLMDLAA